MFPFVVFSGVVLVSDDSTLNAGYKMWEQYGES